MESWVREGMGQLKSMESWVREGMGELNKYGELGKRRNGLTEKVWRVG